MEKAFSKSYVFSEEVGKWVTDALTSNQTRLMKYNKVDRLWQI